jgi:hypothetical protein
VDVGVEAEEMTEAAEEEAVVVVAENPTVKIKQLKKLKKRVVQLFQTKKSVLTSSPICRNILRHPITLGNTILK